MLTMVTMATVVSMPTVTIFTGEPITTKFVKIASHSTRRAGSKLRLGRKKRRPDNKLLLKTTNKPIKPCSSQMTENIGLNIVC